MKPKLQDFASAAGIKRSRTAGKKNFVYSHYSELEGHSFSPENLEKFAELIIRECNSLVENYINRCGEIGTLPDDVILGHFGVK